MASIVQHKDQAATHTAGRLVIGTDIAYGEAGAPTLAETPIYSADTGAGVACVIDIGTDPATRAANARRLVAAWGSWGTVPTEEIEALDRMGGVVALARVNSANATELRQLRASLGAAELLLIERDATIAHLRQRDSERIDIPLYVASELPGQGEVSDGSGND